MFTGIVTSRGAVLSARDGSQAGSLRRLKLRPEPALEDVCVGDSVAVDGCCLTVVALDGGTLAFDVVPETLRRTTLGERAPGDRVNLEPALRVGEALGGHWVQGHVDGVATVRAVERRGEDVRLVFGLPESLRDDLLPKGSVTLDGVSLTVGEVWEEEGEARAAVYLIPHTLEVTGLDARGPGARLNVEADVLGRWVRHHLERMQGG